MPGGNKKSRELLRRLEAARDQLNEAIALLAQSNREITSVTSKAQAPRKRGEQSLDFSIPIRAFIKRYAGGMSGAQKFVLLIAHMSKGAPTAKVSLADIERGWNKMTAKGLLGMKFNRLYSSRARENDWVATEKAGLYHLRPSWKEILK